MADHGVEIRALREDDDLDAQADLSERAFGPKPAADMATWRRLMEHVTGTGATRAAFVDGRQAGGSAFFDMRQWWHGRAVPMAGVSGVKVAPEDRGRGIGRAMMTALLDEIAGRGYPLSVLYPATLPLYRSLGWEQAGTRYKATIPARALRQFAAPDAALPHQPAASSTGSLRRPTETDAATVIDVIGRAHEAARDCGPLTWDAAMMAIRLSWPGWYTYLNDDGFTGYSWHNGNDELFVASVRASTSAALRELWSVIASHASIAETVTTWISPIDPLWHLTTEQEVVLKDGEMWMLRVVDAPAAIAARGFPPGVTVDVPLVIVDQCRPANSGDWLLSIAEGKGELTPGKSAGKSGAAATLGARGLAALYAGTPVASLRMSGLAAGGDPVSDAKLDGAFAATPYLIDGF